MSTLVRLLAIATSATTEVTDNANTQIVQLLPNINNIIAEYGIDDTTASVCQVITKLLTTFSITFNS
jgi:hypothetical protein